MEVAAEQIYAEAAEKRRERKLEYRKRYYAANRDRLIQQMRAYRIANIEVIRQREKNYRTKNAATRAAAHRAWRETNHEYNAASKKEWYKNNQGRVRESRLKKYGISLKQFEAMLSAQNGKCAICPAETPGGRGTWHVDHDHDTGRVRQLLCHYCNIGLGAFKHDVASLQSAIDYLNKHVTLEGN